MKKFDENIKAAKAMAYDVAYTATDLKKVLGLAQEGEVATEDLLGYLNVKSEEMRRYADDLQGIRDAILRDEDWNHDTE